MIIKTERLLLRPLCLKDLKTVHAYASDLENTQYMLFLPNETEQETAAFLSSVEQEWAKEHPECFEFAIVWMIFRSVPYRFASMKYRVRARSDGFLTKSIGAADMQRRQLWQYWILQKSSYSFRA